MMAEEQLSLIDDDLPLLDDQQLADVVDEDAKHLEEITLRVRYDRYGNEPAETNPLDWRFRLRLGGIAVRNVEVVE
jgi:hypothetical protein